MYGQVPERNDPMNVMDERWKIMYHEDNRSPTHSVAHYIAYLRRYVSETSHQRAGSLGRNSERLGTVTQDHWETRPVTHATSRSTDSISPLSYFIRKLKLDLKMAYPSFVQEFVQAPNNGLRLLLSLLKNLQTASSNPTDFGPRTGAIGTLKMDEYKQNMMDEQDCLLCIKYTLRIRSSVEDLVEHNTGLFTVTSCVLSNFSMSRITALEILTLLLTGPSSVDKVLDAFTSLRVKYAESTRFKMLINMMHTRGVSHVHFQVSCLRLLNSLLNLCKSANMRVFLQYEMEEAGLDWKRIQEKAEGNGLENDDLTREIKEWKMRYIDVDCILRKIKMDLKAEFQESPLAEFNYDQRYGRAFNGTVMRPYSCHNEPLGLDYEGWRNYIQLKKNMGSYRARQATPASGTPNVHDRHMAYITLPVGDHLPTPEHHQHGCKIYNNEAISSSSGIYLNNSAETSFNDVECDHNSKTNEICKSNGSMAKVNCETLDRNWMRSSSEPDRKSTNYLCQQNVRQGDACKNYGKGDHYDSGVSVTYQDLDMNEENAIHWDNFYPRDIGKNYHHVNRHESPGTSHGKDTMDSDALRWCNSNTGILPTSRICNLQWQTKRVSNKVMHSNQDSLISKMGQQGVATKPRTPTPDYNNEDANEFYNAAIKKPDPNPPATASTTSNVSRNLQTNNQVTQQKHPNFQRAHNGRKRSIPDNNRPSLPTVYIDKGNDSMPGQNKPRVAQVDGSNYKAHSATNKNRQDFLKPPFLPGESTYPWQKPNNLSAPGLKIIPISVLVDSGESRPAACPTSLKPVYKSKHGKTLQPSGHNQILVVKKSVVTSCPNRVTADIHNSHPPGPNNDCKKSVCYIKSSSDTKLEPDSRSTDVRTHPRENDAAEEVPPSRESVSSGVDSLRSYSAEIGRVLSDLDQTLETHGWQESCKQQVKTSSPPLVAYV